MPENLIAEYPLKTWVIDMETFDKAPVLVARARTDQGSLHHRPNETKIWVDPTHFDSLVFHSPWGGEPIHYFLGKTQYLQTVHGFLANNTAELNNLVKSCSLEPLPRYFSFEVFDDFFYLKEITKKGNLVVDGQEIIQKWQQMSTHCYTKN